MKENKIKRGQLIIISGPSGVGKGTICAELFKNKTLNLVYSVSMTTRTRRSNEIDGINYFFVSPKAFAKAIKQNDLLEYAEFVGNFYGTPRKYCEQMLDQGKNVVLEIEVQGALQVLKNFPTVLSIFLIPPSFEELANRIRTRNTESAEMIEKRLNKAALEINLTDQYDYVVVNDELNRTVNEIESILSKELNVNGS